MEAINLRKVYAQGCMYRRIVQTKLFVKCKIRYHGPGFRSYVHSILNLPNWTNYTAWPHDLREGSFFRSLALNPTDFLKKCFRLYQKAFPVQAASFQHASQSTSEYIPTNSAAPETQTFRCNESGRTFNHQSNLIRHRFVHQPTKKGPCPICAQLLKHLRYV